MVFATGMDTRTVTTSATRVSRFRSLQAASTARGWSRRRRTVMTNRSLQNIFFRSVSAMIKPMTSMVMGVRHWLKPEIVL